jgi:hypothetical protein
LVYFVLVLVWRTNKNLATLMRRTQTALSVVEISWSFAESILSMPNFALHSRKWTWVCRHPGLPNTLKNQN